MRTLAGVPVDKQQRIAQETLDIYAPLANRLGMQEIKQQLEDLSFSALYPKRFAELDHLVSSRTPERDVYLAKAIAEVRARLADVNITGDVTGRGKHLWSIYEKMIQKDKDFDEIFDLVAVRIIVDNIREQVLRTQVRMKEIDIRGSFEADDEVGYTFKALQEIIDELNAEVNKAYESNK
jgi:GTP pyrophosphokinase